MLAFLALLVTAAPQEAPEEAPEEAPPAPVSAPPSAPPSAPEASPETLPETPAAEAVPPDDPEPATAPAITSDGLRILVVAPKASPARVEEIYSGLRAAGLQPVELDERAGVDREASAPPRVGVRDEARAHLQEAKARFRELDIDGTRSALDAAVDEVLRLARPEDALEVLVDALLLRASLALQAELVDEARAALVLLSRIEPARAELHPGLYAPSLVEAYAAARSEEQARPEGVLVVRPRVASFVPPELLVDGRTAPVGAPLALRAGPHLVTVRAGDEALPFSQIVEVGPTPVALEPFLAPPDTAEKRAALVAKAREAPTLGQRAAALAALAPLCAARAVLYVDKAAASLWVPGKPIEALRVAPTADGAVMGRATLATLQAPVRKDPIVGPPVEEPLDPVVIAAVATVGVVLLTGTIALGLYTLTPPADAIKERPAPALDPVACCLY